MKSANNEKFVIFKHSPGIQSLVNCQVIRLKSFAYASCTNVKNPASFCAFEEQSSCGHARRFRFGHFMAASARYIFLVFSRK